MKLNIITAQEAYKKIRKPLPKPSISFKNKKKYNRRDFKKIS